MTALEADPAIALDAGARELLATFVAHVVTIASYDRSCVAMIEPINVLLLAALSGGAGAPIAWSMLYRMISKIVSRPNRGGQAQHAYAFLQSFIRENEDLARD